MAGHFCLGDGKFSLRRMMAHGWGHAPSPSFHAVLQGLRFTVSLHGPGWATVVPEAPVATVTPVA
jgi:hypothetical protein